MPLMRNVLRFSVAMTVALLGVGCEPSTNGSAATLYPGPIFLVGDSPESVVVADVNGDGTLDVVTANTGGTVGPSQTFGNVSVLLGKGDGSYQAQRIFVAGNSPISVAVADMNGDDLPDVVTANNLSDDVSVLLGNGDGTFLEQQSYAVGAMPISIAVADVNVDALPDMVVANRGSEDVSVLLGLGDGTFQAQLTSVTEPSLDSVAVRDMDGDGLSDLVVVSGVGGIPPPYSSISIYAGRGDGSFYESRTFAVPQRPQSVVVADLNNDGSPDLLVRGSRFDVRDGRAVISVYLGNANGTFQSEREIATYFQFRFMSVADLDHDGILDLSVVVPDGVFVYIGNGDGTFQDYQAYAAGISAGSLAVADVDKDYVADLVVASLLSNDVSVLFGNGDGTFPSQQQFPTGPSDPFPPPGSFPRSIVAADLDGNGAVDLLTANVQGNDVSILVGNGDGTFQTPQIVPIGDFARFVEVAVADVDDDGILDLIILNQESFGEVWVLLGNGDGTFQPELTIPFEIFPISVAVTDADGDGRSDLVVITSSFGAVWIMLGNGDGTFQARQNLASDTDAHFVVAADVDGDRHPDLVAANASGDDVLVLLGNGDGTFRRAGNFEAGSGPGPILLTVADLDGDGHTDVVTANGPSDDISVLLGNGDGTFQPQQSFSAGFSPTSVAVADVDGDGAPDVVTANSGGSDFYAFARGNISLLLGNGDGTFQPPQNFTANFSPVAIAVADFDGDGLLDLVAANQRSDDISVLLHR